MSNKLIAGIFAGALAGISIAVLLKAKIEKDNYEEENSLTENDNLDKANEFLLLARRKAEKMISDAEFKSSSILEEAGKILFHAKEKTSTLHYGHKDTALEEISRLKKDIESVIEDFKRKLESDL